jgi:hypothetical protein
VTQGRGRLVRPSSSAPSDGCCGYHTAFDQWPQAPKHLYVARPGWLFENPRSNPRLSLPSYRLPDFVIADLRPKSAYLFVRPGSVSWLFVEVLLGSRLAHRRQSKRLNDPRHEQAHVRNHIGNQ